MKKSAEHFAKRPADFFNKKFVVIIQILRLDFSKYHVFLLILLAKQ